MMKLPLGVSVAFKSRRYDPFYTYWTIFEVCTPDWLCCTTSDESGQYWLIRKNGPVAQILDKADYPIATRALNVPTVMLRSTSDNKN